MALLCIAIDKEIIWADAPLATRANGERIKRSSLISLLGDNFGRTLGRLLFAEHRRTLEAAIAIVAHELATPVRSTRISRGVVPSTMNG